MKIAISAAIIAASASVTFAGSPDLVPADTVAIAAPAAAGTDWSGLYGGLSYAFASGEMYDIGGPYVLNDDGSFYGGFVGYRHDFGNFVVGGEVATSFDTNLYQASFPTWEFTSLTDIKATVGYDLGRFLVFGSAGYTTSAFQTPNEYTYDGWNAGAGVDFMVTDNIFIGGEYVYRSLSRTDLDSWTGEFDSWQLRAGYRF